MEAVELGPADAPELAGLYEEYGWWADRDVGEVREALANTMVALGVRADGDLVAAARVVGDGVYYAKCYDVVVAEDRRGEGIGAELLAAAVSHPDLVGRVALADLPRGTRRLLRTVRLRAVPEPGRPAGR